jgi:dimethylglycine dehydrogenase
MDWLRLAHAPRAAISALDTELIPRRKPRRWPLIDEKQFVGAMWDPVEGHLDPSGTTHAYAKAARSLGAESRACATRSRTLTQRSRTAPGTSSPSRAPSGPSMWSTAGGLWAREVGRMVGLELPVLAMEHMYLITEEMPEVVAFNKETGREMIGVHRFRGRALHAPGAQRHPARHL